MANIIKMNNFGDYPTARASGGGSSAMSLLDGGVWAAGNFAPQWVEFDLGRPTNIRGIRITPWQNPRSCHTVHQVKCGMYPNPTQVVAIMDGVTDQGNDLSINIGMQARFIRIETVKSASWVAWKDLRIF